MTTEILLSRAFMEAHPADAARLLEAVPPADAAGLLVETPPAPAADVLRRMVPAAAADLLEAMAVDDAGKIIAALPLDSAAGLLRRVDGALRARYLAALPEEVAGLLGLLLRYPDGTAGALMDPLTLALPDDITVGDALERIRDASRYLYYYVYVVSREQKLVGVLDLRELMLARLEEPLASVMRFPSARLSARADLQAVLVHPGWQDLDALPVVDEEGTLVGVIRSRALRRLSGELRGRPQVPAAVSLALALGELYWVGLSGLLRELGRRAEARGGAREGGVGDGA